MEFGTLDQVKFLELPKVEDDRGNLSFIEENNHIPFKIERSYLIYDVPGGEIRGGHAYHVLQEFIVALSGSFDVILDDGKNKMKVTLNRSYNGVFVPNGIWRSLENFSTNSLCMILASEKYSEKDYIRDYDNYKKMQIEK
jgi:dTDP-4-dehydrorhamnose 3,5-epimerase-like enzyme